MNEKHLKELQDGSLVKYNGELLCYYEYVYDAGLYSLMGVLKHTFTAGFILNKMQFVHLYEKFTINGEEVYVWQVLGFDWSNEILISKDEYKCTSYLWRNSTCESISLWQTMCPVQRVELKNIKYAHQVQALYRILTGKPLKLKLPKSK